MDLKMFFEPVGIEASRKPGFVQSSIYVNTHKMPDHDGLDIALIGLDEYRGEEISESTGSALAIRKELYSLTKGSGDYGIVDLGNLRSGPTHEDTLLRIKEVGDYLMNKGILPVYFGGSHDLDVGQFYSYEESNKLITLLSLDNKIDLEGDLPSQSHHAKILKHAPNYLFHINHLGYQSYLTTEGSRDLIEELSFESLRLGELRKNFKETEPFIRQADMISFDVASIKSMPGSTASKPFGFTGEEACQICWYAGMNEKLSSIGIYGYNGTIDKEENGAFIVATMIWYFIEGYYNRKGDKSFFTNDYLVYEVQTGKTEALKFYKSKLSERWWVEIPKVNNGPFNRNRIIACSYSEYEAALNGELSDRWMKFMDKV